MINKNNIQPAALDLTILNALWTFAIQIIYLNEW